VPKVAVWVVIPALAVFFLDKTLLGLCTPVTLILLHVIPLYGWFQTCGVCNTTLYSLANPEWCGVGKTVKQVDDIFPAGFAPAAQLGLTFERDVIRPRKEKENPIQLPATLTTSPA